MKAGAPTRNAYASPTGGSRSPPQPTQVPDAGADRRVPITTAAHGDGHTGRVLPEVGSPGADLPVRSALPALIAALDEHGAAVLLAPPGTGKTTLVPLALAGVVPGRVIVAEPRRRAARELGREVGLRDEDVVDVGVPKL